MFVATHPNSIIPARRLSIIIPNHETLFNKSSQRTIAMLRNCQLSCRFVEDHNEKLPLTGDKPINGSLVYALYTFWRTCQPSRLIRVTRKNSPWSSEPFVTMMFSPSLETAKTGPVLPSQIRSYSSYIAAHLGLLLRHNKGY